MATRASSHSASKKIVQAIGVFSGMKILGILCSLVRNKLIAWLIGPAGLGLVMLYNSFVELISQVSRLSIDQSVQRDIAQSSKSEVPAIISVVNKWALWLGMSGALLMCLLSPLLSFLSFDTFERWPVFCLLSLVPITYTLMTCIYSENQGLRRFKAVATSNVLSTVTSLALTVPLIIWLRIDSIPWIIVTYAVIGWACAWLFRPRVAKVNLPRKEVVDKGRTFIKLGFQITLGMALAQLATYIFVLFLNNYASTGTLGLYQAGYTMMNSYVGIVFTALWMEYYPRLSACVHSRKRLILAASHEARLTLSILTPLLCVLIVLINPVIRLVYSSDFLLIIPYVVTACIGIVFRITSYCLVYIILAKGDGHTFLITESTSVLVGLVLNFGGYLSGGLLGLGIAYAIWYFVYTVIVGVICYRKYRITYSKDIWLLVSGALAVVSLTAVLYLLFA